MNNRFVEIICLLLLVVFFSCSKEVGDVASSDKTYTYKLDMSASLSTYDDEPRTRAGLTFVKGDIIYLCFNPGSSDNEVYGTASYDGYTWNLTTTESLDFATSGYCNAKYFAGAKSYTSTKVEFDQYSVVYDDYTSWSRNGYSVQININLTPVLARIRFKGEPGISFQLSGITWEYEYRHEKNKGYYLGNKSPMTVTIQSSGYSPYIYGYFTSSTSPSLTIVSNDVTYTMSCDNSMFQQGQSGWLNLPTRTSHTGWTSSADESDPYPVAGAVDLGLPSGILWSSWNMGASEVGEYGGYYCWGDASGECKTSQEYNIPNGTDNICGDPKFDMATVQWGVGAPDGHTWRLPYVSEFDELFANCTETYIKDYFGDGTNVEVKKLTGPNGNYIILPRSGYMDSYDYKSKGVQGCYWTCESYSVSTGVRWYYNSTTLGNNWSSGTSGFYRMSIRPVLGNYVRPKTDEDIEREDKEGETEKAGEAVQLGLSVRWANCNVGAANKRPTEFGDFYAWGERTVKSEYTLQTYQLYDALTKAYTYIGDDINSTIYDVASIEWGGKWYTPTDDDWYALVRECTWVWKENYQGSGINGYQIFGKGDYENNYIFLPATGFKTTFGMYENAKGYYWSSSVFDNTDKPDWNIAAWYVSFSDSSKGMSYFDRYSGYSIRPVKK